VSDDRDVYCVVVKKDGVIVGVYSFEKQDDAKLVQGRLAATAPEHRGARLASSAMPILEGMARAVDADLILVTATLKHPLSQRLAEAYGYRLVGIIPGFDRDMIAPGVVKRVFEALYAKILAPKEHIQMPKPGGMTATTLALFAQIFSSEMSEGSLDDDVSG